MISMLGYILLPLLAGVTQCSIGFPMTLLVIVHFFIIRPAFGWGWVPDLDADVYYPLVALMFSIIGWLYAYAWGCRNVFWGKIGIDDTWGYRILRAVKAFVLHIVLAAQLLTFELIPFDLWFGGFLTLVIVVVADVLFWVFFRKWDETSPMYERAYLFPSNKQPRFTKALALQMMIWLMATHVVCVIVFWILYYGNWLWQFWVALILFGASLIAALVGLFIGMYMSQKSKSQ